MKLDIYVIFLNPSLTFYFKMFISANAGIGALILVGITSVTMTRKTTLIASTCLHSLLSHPFKYTVCYAKLMV